MISDEETHIKKIIFSPALLAKEVFADPELTLALPPSITAATGMDAFTHCVEAYLAKGYHPICDGIALEGMSLASKHLLTAVQNPSDIEARAQMMMASMMGAIAREVRAHGGRTIGVIPQALLDFEVGDRDADELIVTTDMRTRKAAMDNAADAFIALPGGIGTLEELLEVWTSASLAMHSKPVIVLDPWEDFAPLREMVETLRHRGFVRPTALNVIEWTVTVDQAIAALQRPQPHVVPLEHNEVRDI